MLTKNGNEAKRAQSVVAKLFGTVAVLDRRARGSLIIFAERGFGEVFISWENEAFLKTFTLSWYQLFNARPHHGYWCRTA